MLIVSFISLKDARTNLRQNAESILEQTANNKTRDITQYFVSMLKALKFEGESQENLRFLEKLVQARNNSNKNLGEFVGSFRHAMLVDKMAHDLIRFRSTFNFHDVFIIASNGDILFSVSGKDDLGTNLSTGPYKETRFAAATRKSIVSGETTFSDYEHYAPSKGLIFGFLCIPIINDSGDRAGVLAAQFPIAPINKLLNTNTNLEETLTSYLVGPDLTLRSEMAEDRQKALLDQQILTNQTKLYQEELEAGISASGNKEHAFLYQGPLGNKVMGVRHVVEIEDIRFALITEVATNTAFAAEKTLRSKVILLSITAFLIALFLILPLVLKIIGPLVQLTRQTEQVAKGDYSIPFELEIKNEIGVLSRSFNTMVAILQDKQDQEKQINWLQDGQVELNALTRKVTDLPRLCRKTVTFLAKYLGAEIGAMYIVDGNRLKLTGSYAFTARKSFSSNFKIGEGIVGQATLEKQTIILTSVPDDYMAVRSGLGESTPRSILIVPIIIEEVVLAVIELGSLDTLPDQAQKFIELVSENIGISIQTLLSNIKVQELLERSQTQTEELAAREEELTQTNKILEKQTLTLKASEASLQAQQEELRQTNEELEEQSNLLEKQKNSLNIQNIDLEKARKAVEQKAEQLDTASRYKSEFLANMSHELRTPLNSILLLSQHLANNKEKTMTEKQVECASTVHKSGAELLNLINEILDLAKVESGKMLLEVDDCYMEDITTGMKRNFQPVANNNGVEFILQVAEDVPESIRSDCQRISQVIKNLLSNAFKFTEHGSVTLAICKVDEELPIRFMVTDSGIGIGKENIESIFHAFQQEDGSTSRKYGGTGLGLSISRELAKLLGGTLEATSSHGEGAVFTLALPETVSPKTAEPEKTIAQSDSTVVQPEKSHDTTHPKQPPPEQLSESSTYLPDDRKETDKSSHSILIIEDDQTFAKILRDSARERGFKTLVAESGEIGLQMTEEYNPDGIILDLGLPGMDGKHVLARLKEDLKTRHIPVHIVSAADDTNETRHMGAVGYLTKPVNMEALNTTFSRIEKVLFRKVKKVLHVEDDEIMCQEVADLIGNGVVKVTTARTGAEARELQKQEEFDCIIVDLGLPDINGCDLIKEMKKDNDFNTPVIIHTARELTSEEQKTLDILSDSIVVKDAKSMDKLLDESSLFLHRIANDLPEEKQTIIRKFHDREAILENKKIMIVDDDMRNVFSLSSILEEKGIVTEMAENGRVALEKLAEHPDTDLILMDIMMPEMDGYETMREIRKMDSKLGEVAIIALTAKAMMGDRAKCIDAGANDYLAKPVDAEKLFSMLRVWLY